MPLRSRRFLMEFMKGMEQYFFNGIFCIFSFTFSVPSKLIIIVIQFMFLGINTFWALLRAHFNHCLMAQAEMILT